MAESIKSLENLPAKLQKRIMEDAYKEILSKEKGEKTLPLSLNGIVYEIPEPVWRLIEKLSDGIPFNKG